MSKGEEKIAKILSKNKIPFQREVSVPFLSGKKGAPLRFDFGIFDEGELVLLIEFDGEQHFQYSPYFHKKKSDFTYRKGCDRKKNEWALNHKVPLFRIPYWKIEEISSFTNITNKEFLVQSIYHNDRLIRDMFGGD